MLLPIIVAAAFKLALGMIDLPCSIPWIWSGNIENQVVSEVLHDGDTFQYTSYENVPVGSVVLHNRALFLACQQDHLVIGLGVSRIPITCLNGKWTQDPICRKKDCSVPWISNGHMEEQTPFRRYNFLTFRDELHHISDKVPVNTVPRDNATLFLVCQEDYVVLGLNASKTQIICSEGEWTPQPVCLKSFESRSSIVSRTSKLRSSMMRRSRNFSLDIALNISGYNDTPCIVPYVHNGKIVRSVKSELHRFQFKEIPVGESVEDGEILNLLCHQGYKPAQGWFRIRFNEDFQATVSCKDFKWPSELLCIPSRRHRPKATAIVTTASPVGSTSIANFVDRSGNSAQNLPTTPTESQENCACTYNSHDRKLSAVVNGVGLWYGDKVKKGDITTLRCQDPANRLVLPNAMSISGSLTLICDVCRTWEDSDLPSCYAVGSEQHLSNRTTETTIAPATSPVGSASTAHETIFVDRSESATLKSSTSPNQMDHHCSCTYNSRQWNLFSVVNGTKLRLRNGGKVKKGDKIIVSCRITGMHPVLKNTTGTHGSLIMTCDECRTWEDSDLPSCEFLRSALVSSTRTTATAVVPTGNPLSSTSIGPEATPVHRSDNAAQNVPAVPKQDQEENCSCIYMSRQRHLFSVVNGKGIWYGDKVKKGDEITLRCRSRRMHLSMRNDSRIHEEVRMTCNVCQTWEDNDLPSCRSFREALVSSTRTTATAVVPTGNPLSSTSIGPEATPVHRSDNAAQNVPAVPKQDQEENCSCIYMSRQMHLFSVVNGKGIRYGDKVKKGDEITLRCRSRRIHLLMRNDSRTHEEVRMTCNVCQTWEDNDLPSCRSFREARCTGPPPPILFGKAEVIYNGQVYVAKYTCGNQYVLVGSDEVRCISGDWRGRPPTCEKTVGCLINDLIDITPMHMMPDSEGVTAELLPAGSEVPLFCEENMLLTGDKKATCGPHGNWEYGKAQCVLGCLTTRNDQKVSPLLIMEPVREYYWFGEFVLLSCPAGHELTSGTQRIICIGTNIWSDEFPDCREI